MFQDSTMNFVDSVCACLHYHMDGVVTYCYVWYFSDINLKIEMTCKLDPCHCAVEKVCSQRAEGTVRACC